MSRYLEIQFPYRSVKKCLIWFDSSLLGLSDSQKKQLKRSIWPSYHQTVVNSNFCWGSHDQRTKILDLRSYKWYKLEQNSENTIHVCVSKRSSCDEMTKVEEHQSTNGTNLILIFASSNLIWFFYSRFVWQSEEDLKKDQFDHHTTRPGARPSEIRTFVEEGLLSCIIKGGPEPLEKEINGILGSKREDRFSDPFFDLVQNTSLVRFSYLFRLCNFCKAPRDMRKFPQKCRKIAGCWGRTVYVHNFRSPRHLAHPLRNNRVWTISRVNHGLTQRAPVPTLEVLTSELSRSFCWKRQDKVLEAV